MRALFERMRRRFFPTLEEEHPRHPRWGDVIQCPICEEERIEAEKSRRSAWRAAAAITRLARERAEDTRLRRVIREAIIEAGAGSTYLSEIRKIRVPGGAA